MRQRLIASLVVGALILGGLFTWFFGNYFYDLFWAFLDAHQIRQANVIAYTLGHITPFILSCLVVAILFFVVRYEYAHPVPALSAEQLRQIEAQETHAEALRRQAEAIENQNWQNDPMRRAFDEKFAAQLTRKPKPALECTFNMNDPGCVLRNLTLTERASNGTAHHRRCDWYRVRVDASVGNISGCQGRLLSVMRADHPLLAGETPILPFAHGSQDGTKTVHVGVSEHLDLLAIFENNHVMLCVPPSHQTSSINWGDMFTLAGDYKIKVAVTSPDAVAVSQEFLFRWTLNRATSEIVCPVPS